jgi:hypothetical protein
MQARCKKQLPASWETLIRFVWPLGFPAGAKQAAEKGLDLGDSAKSIPQGLLIPVQEMSCTVPTGLRSSHVESAFPTLKRGANEHCASGAARTLLMQRSIKPNDYYQSFAARLKSCPYYKTCSPSVFPQPVKAALILRRLRHD